MVRHISDRIAVMYLGQMMEIVESDELFNNHYIHILFPTFSRTNSRSKLCKSHQRVVLEGDVPSPLDMPSGCPLEQGVQGNKRMRRTKAGI